MSPPQEEACKLRALRSGVFLNIAMSPFTFVLKRLVAEEDDADISEAVWERRSTFNLGVWVKTEMLPANKKQ